MLETGYLIFLKTQMLLIFIVMQSVIRLVDGQETDIVFSFGTGTLQSSYNFVMDPQRVFFNPVNKTSISSIRIYITDGRRRPVYLNHTDVAFSLILKYVPDF